MAGCFVLLRCCGGSGVSTLGSCAGGVDGAFGTVGDSLYLIECCCLLLSKVRDGNVWCWVL